MKKLTTSVLAVVLASSFSLVNAQQRDSIKTQTIGEVVITGALGIKKKVDAQTSAQQVVTAEVLNQAGSQNAIQALTAKVSGLQITQTNSSVNSTSSIQLRGARSITGNNEALVVIDGAISTAAVLQQLPPDVIESVNVIKGAQGSALYGSDGVNGVIVVTTKQGARRGLTVTYNANVDFETVAKLPKRQSSYGQGWDGARDAYENGAWGPKFDGTKTTYGFPQYDYDKDGYINLDSWDYGMEDFESGDIPAQMFGNYQARDEVRKFFKMGSIFSNDLTLNAGSEGKYAMLNISNVRRDFVIQDDTNKRTSLLFKGGAKLDRWTIDGSINYIRRNTSETNGGLYWDLLQSAPDIPITAYKDYPDNAFAWNIYYLNPYWYIKHNRRNFNSNYFSAIAGLGFKVNDHINLRYTGNIQNSNGLTTAYQDDWKNTIITPGYRPYIGSVISNLTITQTNDLRYYGDFLANFDYDLSDDLNLNFTLGNNYQERQYKVSQAGGTNLDIPGLYAISNVTKPYLATALDNGTYRRNSYAFFGNVDLNYRDYLFLNATGRNEWTSVLPKGNNSYFYPSVGVSFIPTKAWDFGGDALNYMKIAASLAKVGNSSSIGWYDVNPIAEIGSGFPYSAGTLSYVNAVNQTDPNIRPEFVTSKEVNLILGFLRDKITLSASVFQQDTDDLITTQTASNASGINTKLINIGNMQSKGLEIDLGLTPVKTRDFMWDMNFSYYTAQSKVTKVTDETDEVSLLTLGTRAGVFAKEGYLFPLIKVNMMERDDQGRVIVDAVTGNPLVTSTLIEGGVGVPKHTIGFTTNLKYKGFKFGAVMDYRTGHKFVGDVANGLAFNGTLYESGQIDREKGFIIPNSVYKDASGAYVPNTSVYVGGNHADYSGVLAYYSSIYNRIGENFLFDATAFKIRELSMSYTLADRVLSGTGMDEITFGIHSRNPFVKYAKDNLNYADPETSFSNGNAKGIATSTQYPNVTTYGFSLNVKF